MVTRLSTMRAWLALASAGFLLALAGPAQAQLNQNQPSELEDLELIQKLDAQLPLDLQFKDEDGYAVKLGQYFKGDKPVILTLNYYSCPMLCVLTLNSMVDALRQVELSPGSDYEIVTVSINPMEQSQLTKQKKKNYCDYWADPLAPAAWHFHTGSDSAIKTLADSVGYQFRWVPERREYAHPSVLIICTPDGRVSRYIQGVSFDPQTIRLALVEASAGRIGTVVDDFTLFCYMYDPLKGTYVLGAVGLMKAGGVVTVVVISFWLAAMWAIERRRRAKGDNDEDAGLTLSDNKTKQETDNSAGAPGGKGPAAGASRA